jgi:hypothetical protein
MKSSGTRMLEEYHDITNLVMRRHGDLWARGRRIQLVTHGRMRWGGQELGVTSKPRVKLKGLNRHKREE